jgi:hypothetical protein
MRRADYDGVHLAGRIGIVGEVSGAGQQAVIFAAPDRLSDEFVHQIGYVKTSRTGVLGLMPLARICLERSPLLK